MIWTLYQGSASAGYLGFNKSKQKEIFDDFLPRAEIGKDMTSFFAAFIHFITVLLFFSMHSKSDFGLIVGRQNRKTKR